MKKLFFSAFLLSLATLGFSQTTFTEQTVNEIHQAFVSNPVQAVTERTLPTFKMTGDNGAIIDYTVFKSWQVGGGLAEWKTSEVTVQQSGNLAIAKGISNHRPKHVEVPYNQRFTETYEFQNGKWMLASAHFTDITGK